MKNMYLNYRHETFATIKLNWFRERQNGIVLQNVWWKMPT